MKWFPLLNYTHYSLQYGFSKPNELAKKCKQNSYPACGIADYKTISGAVSFYKACIDNDIKPIIGCSFDGFALFAKNHEGWLNLIEIVSTIDTDGNEDRGIMVRLARKGNLICIANSEALSPITGDDFYQWSDAFLKTFYSDKSQADLHRIVLCGKLKTTLHKVKKNGVEQDDLSVFFDSSDFYLKDKLESAKLVIDDPRMDEFDEILNKVENFNILSKPILPKFDIPSDYKSEGDYLRHLARQGWMTLLNDKIKSELDRKTYGDRFNKEFAVIEKANLFGYFLIVWDILNWCREQGWMVGPGRGSAAGCLISYLVGITEIDPIEFNLLFERFYNEGRNTEDHISLPDVDMDVPGNKRDEIIARLKEKYGSNNVSQMLTFGRLQGRSAMKEVLRVNDACGFAEMNEITKYIPDEAAISDQLSQMDEEDRSIIRWTLQNRADDLMDYCHIDDEGRLQGDFAEYFQQAIDIEGTFKTQGKHAAGVVISSAPLYKVCPMVNQKSGGEKIAGLEMNDLEALGHVKFDLLGLNLLDKLMYIEELLGKSA
jgi:DNA polymerase III subunit alpha